MIPLDNKLWNVDIWFLDKPTIEKAEKYCDDISEQVNNNEQLKTAMIQIKQELISRKLYSFDKYTSIDVYDTVFIFPKPEGHGKSVALGIKGFLYIGYCGTFICDDFNTNRNRNPCCRNLVLRLFNYPYG